MTMDTIVNFCNKAVRTYCSSDDLIELKGQLVHITEGKTEVYRSRYNDDESSLFTMNLGVATNGTLDDEIKFMRTIEMYYPNTFSWRFNGENIEAIALIVMKPETLGIFTRFSGVDNFTKKLRNQLISILKYRNFGEMISSGIIEDKILSTGSINRKTNQYCVPIQATEKPAHIIQYSIHNTCQDIPLKELDMKFWVKEINPDFYKELPIRRGKKYPLTDDVVTKYPLAIQRIAAIPQKGNYNRFLLATYLLSVHNERDAKHMLDCFLSDSEREHMNGGNCKDQWRTIVSKGYPPPSAKTLIETGYAESYTDCVDTFPKVEENEDDEEEEHKSL